MSWTRHQGSLEGFGYGDAARAGEPGILFARDGLPFGRLVRVNGELRAYIRTKTWLKGREMV